MRLHAHAEICVARWTAVRAGRALAGEADALPVAHPRGNLHRQPARLSTVRGGDLDDVLSALVRLGQGDLDLPFDVLPLLRPGPRAGPPSTDEVVHRRAAPEATVRGVPKERAEEIREVARGLAERIAAGARRPVVDPMEVATGLAAHTLGVPLPIGPDRVVPLALLGIAEDLVGLIDLLEALLGLRLLVDVRVVLARQLPVGLLDLAGHRDVLADLATGQCRHDRRRHGHAGRRTVLGDGPRRDVDVHGVVLEEALRHGELRVVRSHVAERRDGRLFHDLLDLTGEDELLLLRSLVHDRRLDGEDVAAVLGHRNAGGRADLVFLLGEAVVEPLGTEVRREVLRLDLDRLGLALGDRSRDLAVDRPDLPLEVADAGLARVLADEPEERVVAHHELAFLETVLLQLLR